MKISVLILTIALFGTIAGADYRQDLENRSWTLKCSQFPTPAISSIGMASGYSYVYYWWNEDLDLTFHHSGDGSQFYVRTSNILSEVAGMFGGRGEADKFRLTPFKKSARDFDATLQQTALTLDLYNYKIFLNKISDGRYIGVLYSGGKHDLVTSACIMESALQK